MSKKIKNSDAEVNKEIKQNEKKTTPSKSIIQTQVEKAEKKNIDEQQQVLHETDELAAGILKAAYEVQKHSEISSLKEDLVSLRSAINTLKTASALSIQNRNSPSLQLESPPIKKDCGCGETIESKCCIELYGSGVRVLNAADGIVPTLELILAIQAGGVKAVFPGLTSQINVNQNVGWVKVDWPITKICVPCNEQMTIPLLVEAMDIDKILSVPEKGSNSGAITINCNCNSCSATIDVNLSSGSLLGGEKKGQIIVEISARKVHGGCCC